MSERVTWESCPGCGGLAAVGWLDGAVVEFDCGDGCRLTEEQEAALRERSAPPFGSARSGGGPSTRG
jgi:hypothetical protein